MKLPRVVTSSMETQQWETKPVRGTASVWTGGVT